MVCGGESIEKSVINASIKIMMTGIVEEPKDLLIRGIESSALVGLTDTSDPVQLFPRLSLDWGIRSYELYEVCVLSCEVTSQITVASLTV